MHAAEDDVLRIGTRGCGLCEFEGIAGDIGELDDLVALIVVPQHEHAITELRLRTTRALDQVGIAGERKFPRARDAAFALEILLMAHEQQCQRRRCWFGEHVRSFACRGYGLPVRLLIAPDDFKGTMTAATAADAIAMGWTQTVPDATVQVRPLSDGGPGFISAIAHARDAELRTRRVRASLGGDVDAIDGYGKGSIVGSAGEIEHGAMWHIPGGGGMRSAIGGGTSIVPLPIR